MTFISLGISFNFIPCIAANDLTLVSGGYRRSIKIKDIEHFAKTGEANGFLGNIIDFSRQNPQTISKLLNQELNLPIVLVSRLVNTNIGEAIIKRISKIIYPLYAPQQNVSIPAIRAGIIQGINNENGTLTAISFLKAYPNKIIAINLPALFTVVQKAKSITNLVKFFSDSPLDGLKKTKP